MSSEGVHESVVNKMGRDFLFQITNGNLILVFFRASKFNSIRGNESSLQVKRHVFGQTGLFRFETVLTFTK